MSRSLNLALVLTLAAPVAAQVRAQALGQGFELERAGRYADAATVYLTTLRADPANLPALLGLERVLPPLSRLAELLPLVQRARAQAPESAALRGLELRVYAGLNEPDSLAAAARRWAGAAPGSDAPYREWAAALASRRAFDDARRVLLLGRRAVDGAGAATIAIDLAELEQRVGNWEGAAREWGRAVTGGPPTDVLPNASSHLSAAPAAERERIVRVLTAPGAAARTRWLGAELLLGWGRPLEGWALFEQTLAAPAPGTETAAALRRYADLAGALATPDGHRVRGLALSRWADLVPSPLAGRARAEAVRALLEGGDRAAARLALERLAGDTLAAPDAQALAEAALLDVLIADGQLDVAERRLAAGDLGGGGTLGGEDRGALRLALARARIARGELDRAAAALGDDSSVAAIAQRGWIALYRGELRGASEAFRAAGPYAGDRAAATERTAMLALLQQIPDDTLPELGAALLALARGDSGASVAALRRVAGGLDQDAGRSDVLLLAGQIASRLDAAHEATAAALFEEIVRVGGAGSAPPAADLAWARLLLRQGRAQDAVRRLEHLILTYPGSAFVPEARRELERARGAIPRS
jgi:tetratricopeptide (TPR) repeat protein